jgi:hypothetical protein
MPNSRISRYWKEQGNNSGGRRLAQPPYNRCEAALTEVIGRKAGKVSAQAQAAIRAGARDRYPLRASAKLTIGIGHIVLDARTVQLGDGVFRDPRTVKLAGIWRPMSSVTTPAVSIRRAVRPGAIFSMRAEQAGACPPVFTLANDERSPFPALISGSGRGPSTSSVPTMACVPMQRSYQRDPRRKDRCRTKAPFPRHQWDARCRRNED